MDWNPDQDARAAAAAEVAARRAGRLLLDYCGRVEVHEKQPADLVTEADWESQALIERHLRDAFPDVPFVGEEGESLSRLSPAARKQPVWVVDPLDGTTNFVHALPAFCVSIALCDEGLPRVGIVYDPVRDELFQAQRGGGATCNGRAMHPSQCTDLASGLVAASLPARVARDAAEVEGFLNVMTACRAIRRWGSAALNLSYVACGRYDGYWAASLKPWDAAAGMLLVSEAGGALRHLNGQPADIWDPRLIAAATPALERALRRCLVAVPPDK